MIVFQLPHQCSRLLVSVVRSTRNSQIGEFYVLQPPQVDPGTGKQLFTCDALIYDEESDRHVRVTWGQALAACCIGDLDNVDMSHKTNDMGDKKLATWLQKARNIQAYNEGKAVAENAALKLPASVDADTNWEKIDKDIRIVVARPFIEHLMHSVVMTVSGRDTVRRALSTNAISQPALTDHASLAHVTGSHALWPGGHAVERQHSGQDHRGPL